MSAPYRRAFCLVLDSLGVGELPDAADFGDAGANTLRHIADSVGGLSLPNLERIGLARIQSTPGLATDAEPTGAWGRMAELSNAKDTSSGHWEMMGQPVAEGFPVFPEGFPKEIIDEFCERAGVDGVLCNAPASGTEVIARLGEEHQRTGLPIVYTSADSVFQIAAHEEHDRSRATVRDGARSAREILDSLRRRSGHRPTLRRRTGVSFDPNLQPPRLLSAIRRTGRTSTSIELSAADIPVVGVGKIEDIFAGRGVAQLDSHRGQPTTAWRHTIESRRAAWMRGFVFVNLVDFDMLYGHRRDPGRATRDALDELRW